MQTTPLTYLALGDSYTIGEAVPLRENFPYQLVALLRNASVPVAAPEIIATTGWTTGELAAAISQHAFLPRYDLVTLLIGVNNQYRGLSIADYKKEFAQLLQQAIHFAGGLSENVTVLSIPDYCVTPFAKDLDREKISREIDAFNAIAAEHCARSGVSFIDITSASRNALNDAEMVAPDGLHPSAKAYAFWAKKVAEKLLAVLRK